MGNRNIFKKVLVLLVLQLLIFLPAFADSGPGVLNWRSFLSYNRVVDFVYQDQKFFCATTSGFFIYNKEENEIIPFSKVNGMNDIGLAHIASDNKTDYVILAYENSNIDLYKDGEFVNLPELKLSQISGDKSINDLSANDGVAYLSTGIGLVLLNLDKIEIKETVRFFSDSITANVLFTKIIGNKIYAATSIGLFSTTLNNSFLTNYLTWEKISNDPFLHITQYNGKIYASKANDIYRLENGTMNFFKTSELPISHLDEGKGGIWVSAFSTSGGSGYLINENAQIIDSVPCRAPVKIISLPDGSTWFGDKSIYFFKEYYGLRKKTNATSSEAFLPTGPVVSTSFDISVHNGELWVAHGGLNLNWQGTKDRSMFSHYKDNHWNNFSWISENTWYQDFVRILKNQSTGKVYAGSFSGGLVIVNPDNSFETYDQGNLPNWFGNPGLHNVAGLAIDSKNNLWISNYGGDNELTVMTPNKQFYQLKTVSNNLGSLPHSSADVIIDDYDQKWFLAPAGGGVIVYDDNGTIEMNTDDRYRILKSGTDNGGLLDNSTTSILKDNDGSIWIGTKNGISIVYCPGDVINGNCEATPKIVQNEEGINDYLFARQNVSSMAVDGANRKWVGTDNGVWLVSEDGEKVIYRFNVDNSPLPSNEILRINIDPVNGDVYFSTQKGIVSFRSTATKASETDDQAKLLIYPNPVPANYSGMIAIRNLSNESDVRITDVSGQLVFKTKSLGGQAVWNGKDYLGRNAQSGVYLVFVVSKDGSKKQEGKFIITR